MKPKRLNLEEMWKLYLLLKPAMDGRKQEDTFLEEISKLIELSNSRHLLECIHILYDNKVEFDTALGFTAAFADGLQKNDFYEFIGFIRGLDGSAR